METGETKWLGLGVVFKDYRTIHMPGWYKGTVGYHTDDRLIFNDVKHDSKKTTLTGNIKTFLHWFVLPVLFVCLFIFLMCL